MNKLMAKYRAHKAMELKSILDEVKGDDETMEIIDDVKAYLVETAQHYMDTATEEY